MLDPIDAELLNESRIRAARAVGRPDLRAPTDLDFANAVWAANCGPGALAAVVGRNVHYLRNAFPHFPDKAFTTLTSMKAALDGLRVRYVHRRVPRHPSAHGRDFTGMPSSSAVSPMTLPILSMGLAQIQLTGPWTAPGANPRWAYTHTHWIAIARGADTDSPIGGSRIRLWVYDVNADHTSASGDPRCSVLAVSGGGWIQAADWERFIVPMLTDIPRADGGWFAINEIELLSR